MTRSRREHRSREDRVAAGGLAPFAAATAAILALALAACAPAAATTPAPADAPLAVLPAPRSVTLGAGTLRLPPTLRCRVGDASLRALVGVLDTEYRMLAGGRVVEASPGERAPCALTIDAALGEQEYRLVVDSAVSVAGASSQAVAMGSVTLMQMLERAPSGAGATVRRVVVRDRPAYPFRALLVDLGRQWHEIPVLEQLVELARWYRIGFVQLHLTDDQLFTFPSRAYPELATPGRHYTAAELRGLDDFARARGVVLIPELEVPGHASLMVARRPDLFGFAGDTGWHGTINMGRERAYAAVDTLIGEIADVFRTTPYIHIGGDEVSLEGLERDPDVQRYLAAHGLADLHELYRQFLVRVDESVRRHGRRTLVWEGFRREDDVAIPRDMTVIAWETKYQLPQDLLAAGFTVINASWKPLYVANEKAWPVEYVYDHWNLFRWENWVPEMPSYTPIQLDSTSGVIGAMMCSWLQPQQMELPSLRRRLAALAERTWSGEVHPARPFAWFDRTLGATDAKLQEVLAPVAIRARGLSFPSLREGHYGEQYWFGDTLVVTLDAGAGRVVRYTLDGTMPTASSPRYERPIVLTATTDLRARAFTPDGTPLGYDRWTEYQLHPLAAEVRGDLVEPLAVLWERVDDAARFRDSVSVALSSRRRGTIRFTLDGGEPTSASRAYGGPITLTGDATVRARLFSAAGEPQGEEWAQRFARAR